MFKWEEFVDPEGKRFMIREDGAAHEILAKWLCLTDPTRMVYDLRHEDTQEEFNMSLQSPESMSLVGLDEWCKTNV